MHEKKRELIVVVTDGWGPKYGGINSFNTDFCKSLGDIIGRGHSVVCTVPKADEKEIKDAKAHNVELLPFEEELYPSVAHHIKMRIEEKIEGEILWWIGHDLISGAIANYGANNIGGNSAIFQHMAYWQYGALKNKDGNLADEKDKKQREIGEDCHLLFGVGPLLTEHACKFKDKLQVIEIIPGLPEIKPENPTNSQFNGIIFGRMNKEDDIIKKGQLGAKAFGIAAKQIKERADITTILTVIGLPNDEKQYKKEYDKLTDIVNKAAEQTITVNPLSYSDNRDELFKRLTQNHVCMMLSWHEGFGLVGWEAIGAEVPLIISKNSGLYKFISEKHDHMTSCLHAIDIKNTKADIEAVVKKLNWIAHNRDKTKKLARKLKEYLLKKGCTWENSARQFAKTCGIPVKPRVIDQTLEMNNKEIKNATSLNLDISEIYLKWITSNYGHMDADKLYGKGEAFPLSLPEIFVPLRAYEPGVKAEREREFEEKNEPLDIESIISIYELLLIEGQPGSGKTTLLKHLAYCLAKNESKRCKPAGMDGFLPILITLKDLNDFLSPEKDADKGKNAKDMLSWFFKVKLDDILNLETIEAFLEANKLIILLDGLDELLPKYRDLVVNAFSDLMIKYEGNKFILTSRPHGIEGAAIRRFGDRHIRILSLNMDQVNQFIHQWFEYLYPGSTGIGGKNAQTMIGEIKEHPSIRQLIDNPLMLTAICILYHDEKELPGQRAELYKKFIDNMLFRRFSESEKVHNFLKTLAFKMHEKRFRGVDGAFATNVLGQVIKRQESESEEDYEDRLKKTFVEIEPKCGLLKLEAGEYAFWHLTFQEFLTAQYIVDNSRDFGKAIDKYWGDDWYKEVIELYIGYLSIENKKWANGIVEDIIVAEDKAPYKKWLLASASFVDIHKDRREEQTLQKIHECMLTIIGSDPEPGILVQTGETLGWLGDTRDLKEFIKSEGGEYELENLGKLKIDPFEIGKYPVTNSWFEEFVRVDGYKNNDYWTPEGREWLGHTKMEYPRFWDERKWKCPNSPVVGVCWYEAYAFTKWLTVSLDDGYEYRLLTEKEWQTAAEGKKGRKYPWGNEWDKNKCNNSELKLEKTSPVGIFKRGNTPEGISDMSGNVWEWTTSDYHSRDDLDDFVFDHELYELLYVKGDLDKYVKKLEHKKSQLPVLRGGSWYYLSESCRCAFRDRLIPSTRSFNIGFRCARTVKL